MSRARNLAYAAPSGAVLPFAGSVAPHGWLLCSGQAVSRADYASLFAAIGTTWGVGDGSTTFNLPDGRGEFLRGLDNGRGVDVGRTLGSAQADQMKAHDGHGAAANTSGGAVGSNYWIASTGESATRTIGGSESRPRNLAMNLIIKT